MADPTWTTVVDAKAHPAIDDAADNAIVGDVLAAVEQRITNATGVAWVPRVTDEQVVASGGRTVWLSHGRCRDLQAVSVDGIAVTDLDRWRLAAHGRLTAPRTLKLGTLIDVTYSHGANEPPHDLLDAALRATGTLLGHGRNPRIGERTSSVVAEGTTINFSAVADLSRGRPFGMPDVDTVVMSYAEQRPAIA